MITLGVDPGVAHVGLAIVNVSQPLPYVSHAWSGSPEEAWEELPRVMHRFAPDLVAIECSEALHDGNPGNKTVLGTVRFAGEVAGYCRHEGVSALYVTPSQVRTALLGHPKRGDDQDAMVKRLLLNMCAGVVGSNVHKRDGIAAAIVGAKVYQRRRVA